MYVAVKHHELVTNRGVGHCEKFVATSISPVHVNSWAAAVLRLVTGGGTRLVQGLENIHFA